MRHSKWSNPIYTFVFLSEASPTENSSSWAEAACFQKTSKTSRQLKDKWRCAAHLGIAQHDHPHQHHIDVNAQRLVVVNLIHLETQRDNQSRLLMTEKQHFCHGRYAVPIIAGLICRDGEHGEQTVL